jgi:hypothetical protein
MVTTAVRHSGVPGAMTWASQRRAGSGKSLINSGEKTGGRTLASASRSHSAPTARASRGTA